MCSLYKQVPWVLKLCPCIGRIVETMRIHCCCSPHLGACQSLVYSILQLSLVQVNDERCSFERGMEKKHQRTLTVHIWLVYLFIYFTISLDYIQQQHPNLINFSFFQVILAATHVFFSSSSIRASWTSGYKLASSSMRPYLFSLMHNMLIAAGQFFQGHCKSDPHPYGR